MEVTMRLISPITTKHEPRPIRSQVDTSRTFIGITNWCLSLFT